MDIATLDLSPTALEQQVTQNVQQQEEQAKKQPYFLDNPFSPVPMLNPYYEPELPESKVSPTPPVYNVTVAKFIQPQDTIPVFLATAIYNSRPSTVMGYAYQEHLSSTRVGIWLLCSQAIVVFKGTTPTNFVDLIDDTFIAAENTCKLSITRAAVPVMRELFLRGFRMILCGHSLGGKAAFCFSRSPGVDRVVGINIAAPIVAPVYDGGGTTRGIHYHIFGDMISTHSGGESMTVVRVKLAGTPQQLNWLDPKYHSAQNFLTDQSYEIASAQEEQEVLEDYFFRYGRVILMSINMTTSVVVNWFGKVSDKVCLTPIPGAKPGKICEQRRWEKPLEKVVANIVGATIAGVLTFNLAGAVAGARIADALITEGNLEALLEENIPGYAQISAIFKKIFAEIYAKAAQMNGDPVQDLYDQIVARKGDFIVEVKEAKYMK